jgi:hypothetical protein
MEDSYLRSHPMVAATVPICWTIKPPQGSMKDKKSWSPELSMDRTKQFMYERLRHSRSRPEGFVSFPSMNSIPPAVRRRTPPCLPAAANLFSAVFAILSRTGQLSTPCAVLCRTASATLTTAVFPHPNLHRALVRRNQRGFAETSLPSPTSARTRRIRGFWYMPASEVSILSPSLLVEREVASITTGGR